MIDLSIDTTDLSQEFNLSKAEVDNLLQYSVEEVSSQFARQWEIQAKTELGSARSEYINAIQITKRSRTTSVVYLNPAAWLPNAIEMGKPSFDMKQGLLKSSKVKYTSKGKPYITVPFRFAVPNSLGESSAFSGVLPAVVHNKAKSQPNKPLSLSQIPTQYHIPKSATLRRQVKSGNFQKVTSKTKMTSIYEGLKKNKSGYMTFRRVSLASDAMSWIHPGFTAKNLAQKALNGMNIPQIVDISIDNYLSELGF